MTALILQATPFVRMVAPTLRAAYRRFLRALDAFAEARMRNAVPAWQLRQARRDINRFDRLMHASTALQGAQSLPRPRHIAKTVNAELMIAMMRQGLEFQQLSQRIAAKAPPQRPVAPRLTAVIANAVRPVRTLIAGVSCALAEHRMHRAAIELELFGGRYKLATKNDDDLPIVRHVARSRRQTE